MARTSPEDLQAAFRLFNLGTDAERERFRALSTLGELDELLNAGCKTQREQEEGERDADVARVASGRKDSR